MCFGTEVLPHSRKAKFEPVLRQQFSVGTSKTEGHELLRRRTTHSRSRREAGFLARRPSRLHLRKTDGVTPLANAPAQET